MAALEPIERSRQLSRAADDCEQWHGRLREAPQFFDDPFEEHRIFLGQSAFEELSDLPEADPLRPALLRWTYTLAEQRINHWWLTHCHQLRYTEQVALPVPVKGKYTRHELVLKGIPSRQEQRHYWDGLSSQARPLSDAEGTFWQRKKEISERFGLTSPDALFAPCDSVVALAERTLESVKPALEELRRSTPHELLQQALALPAADRLPAHLKPSTLADWFRQTRLLDELPLRSWPLPALLAPASFLRGLDELGQELRRAAAPTHQPFVIAHDPRGLENYALGACLAGLLINPAFLEKQLDLPRKQQIDFRRGMARSLLLEMAQRAVKVLLRAAAWSGTAALRETFQSQVIEHLGPQIHPDLALVWLRLQSNDPQRSVGTALGFALARRLRDEHDEDWFRNPRAIEQLRSEAHLPPRCQVPQAEAEQAALLAAEALTEAL
jgi:hypothetical protein